MAGLAAAKGECKVRPVLTQQPAFFVVAVVLYGADESGPFAGRIDSKPGRDGHLGLGKYGGRVGDRSANVEPLARSGFSAQPESGRRAGGLAGTELELAGKTGGERASQCLEGVAGKVHSVELPTRDRWCRGRCCRGDDEKDQAGFGKCVHEDDVFFGPNEMMDLDRYGTAAGAGVARLEGVERVSLLADFEIYHTFEAAYIFKPNRVHTLIFIQ